MSVDAIFLHSIGGRTEDSPKLREQLVNTGGLPPEATEGPYAIGKTILVSRASIAEEIRNPGLPEWFPARVCLPPDEPGNWYRWYDPYIWYETEGDLSNGGQWCTSKRNMCNTGKKWHEGCEKWAKPGQLYAWAYPPEELARSREALTRLESKE